MHEREKKKLEYTPDRLVAMAGLHRCNHMDFKRREEKREGKEGGEKDAGVRGHRILVGGGVGRSGVGSKWTSSVGGRGVCTCVQVR